MAVNTQSFTQLVQNAVSAMQGAASQLIDLTVGSVLRAFVDAYCGLALWLQGLALQVASLTRFSTSNGADADSWAADYGFTRLAAVAAQGTVTFARFTNTSPATIPVGTIVQTADGTDQFAVIADTTQPAYNSALNAYTIAAGVSSVNATVQSTSPGTSGNVTAGLISILGSSVPGIDTVTNAQAFSNGQNAESDAAFKARFVLYLQSLTQGTPTAVEDAVLNLQEGAAVFLVENQNISGLFQPSYFYCVCDDGSGSPSGTFLANCYNAINAVRAVGTTFGVFPPTVIVANVAMVITVSGSFNLTAVEAQVVAALTAFINSLPISGTLPYSRLAQVAYDASPGITNVTGVTLNGGTSDLVATGSQLIKIGTCTVT